MAVISKLEAKEVLDSRGVPTVCASCTLASGAVGVGVVPSGASTGTNEACELRDGDMHRFGGKGVLLAVANIRGEIAQCLLGKDFDQEALDEFLITLDGTDKKERLGANALLAVSIAFSRACAQEQGIQLYQHLANIYFKDTNTRTYKIPQPAFNLINGGKHAKNTLSFQEFLLMPHTFQSMQKKLEAANTVVDALKKILIQEGYQVDMGDEGGFAPMLVSNEKALDYLCKAVVVAGYDMSQVKLGIDAAATTFFKNKSYCVEGQFLGMEDMILAYEQLCTKYDVTSIEDGLYEEDFKGFAEMNRRLNEKFQGRVHIVGDDLTVTNVRLIKKAIENKSITMLVVKPNQIGTLTETFRAIKTAREGGIGIFVSHRSGETEDTFIADLAVAVGAEFIKAGAPTRKERVVKYHRLIEIEECCTSQ